MNNDAPPDDLVQRLEAHISPSELAALQACVRLCAERNASLFLVGGAVRDLLLGRPNLDVDLAIEAPVAAIADALASETGGRAVVHTRFGTATVSGPGFQLDLARTRRETYERPGALPDVEPGSLADDLARRDFTISALALRLTAPAGELIDAFGGLDDLRAGLVRALHERSFQDDATRMLRAARYAARLGFAIEASTEAWLRRDIAYIDSISGPRLRRELSLLFEEPAAVDGTVLAERLGILKAIHSALSLDERAADRWRLAVTGPRYAPLDELGFCMTARADSEVQVRDISRRLHLLKRVEKALLDLVRLNKASAKLAAALGSPSSAVDLLDAAAPAAVWAFGALGAPAEAEVCRRYLEEWRRVRPLLSGRDLLALGVTPGAAVGETLRKLRAARVDGVVSTRDDEVALVRTGIS